MTLSPTVDVVVIALVIDDEVELGMDVLSDDVSADDDDDDDDDEW